MAKMGEGTHYYYLPHIPGRWEYNDQFYICKRDSPHPNYTVIVAKLSQDNASLIVDALNLHESIQRRALYKAATMGIMYDKTQPTN